MSNKRNKATEYDKAWTQGFATALSITHSISPDKELAADVLHESGLSVDDLKAAGVEDYDMRQIEASIRYRDGEYDNTKNTEA
jgi:hypothetical protein